MPISGSFSRFTAVQQPYTGTANDLGPNGPLPAHGQRKDGVPFGTHQTFIGDKSPGGGGLAAAIGVAVRMAANGIIRDFSRTTDTPSTMGNGFNTDYKGRPNLPPNGLPNAYNGTVVVNGGSGWIAPVNHAATAVVRRGLAVHNYEGIMGASNYGARTGSAHGDMTTARVAGHEYSPIMADFYGQSTSEDMVAITPHGTALSGRMIAKSHTGGEFTEGPAGAEYGPVFGDKTGEGKQRRWVMRQYSSPAIGAYYSAHTLRGVLPNTIATPYPQPGVAGGATNKNAGIPPNARDLALSFKVPQLFRGPTSMADNIAVINDGSIDGNNLGMGM